MDQIREQTRRQNLASAQLQRSKLEGWETAIDAFAGNDPGPEIVVVNARSIAAAQASPALPAHDTPELADSLPETLEALDRAVDRLLERGNRPSPRNPMAPPHRNPISLERTRSPVAEPPTPSDTESRRNDFGEAFASAAAALAPLPPVPSQLAQALAASEEPSRQRLDQFNVNPFAFDSAEVASREPLLSTSLSSTLDSAASTADIRPTANEDEAETAASTAELSAVPLSSALASEKAPRHQEALERIGRTIARQLFEIPALLDATSLLLVATGGVRRAMDCGEHLGRGVAWHLDRPVQLVAFEAHDVSVWNELNEVTTESTAIPDWKDAARIVRYEQDARFTSLELAIEKGDSRRLRPDTLRAAARRSRRSEACEIWLVDASERDLCKTLGPICDATVLLIDLPLSRVETCRDAAQNLREYGARLVGTIVINDFEER